MIPKISNYIFSVCLLLPFLLSGQKSNKKDTVKVDYKPTGVRVGWDAISTAKSFSTADFKGWEVNGDIDFSNYYMAVEVGQWQRDINLSNGDYANNGNYWRVGVDINMLKKDPSKNMFFLGFRFGHSKYDEQLLYTDTTEFGIHQKSLSNSNLKANWAEVTTGLKVKIAKGFWMGYTARIKFSASYDKDQQLQTYDIPGFGLTFKKPWWGFNYYLMYRIPITKKESR